MSNAWFENYKRRMAAERAASPSLSSVASSALNGEANNMLKRRNAVYTRKAAQWKENVAAGKVNVTPAPTRRNQNKLTREEFRRRLMEESRPPVEPVFSNVAQWKPLAQVNEAAKAQKQADLAAYFAAMKSKKPTRNIRHTSSHRKNRRKTRRRRN
jgi:hypothetical protein